MTTDYITTAEAAKILGITPRRVVALINSGDLHARKFGHAWSVDARSVRKRASSKLTRGRPRFGVKDASGLHSYTLMNSNHEVAQFTYNADTHLVEDIHALRDIAYAPLGILTSRGRPGKLAMSEWLSNRYIPQVRPHLNEALRKLGFKHPADALFASYGLNLSDQYWFKPDDMTINWQDINFFDNGYDDRLGRAMDGDISLLRKGPAPSPSAGTPGALVKWWERRRGRDYLIKGGDIYDREPYNELLATKLYELLLDKGDFVPYAIEKISGHVFSVCPCFIDTSCELVTMADVMSRYSDSMTIHDYDTYLQACTELGVPDAQQQLSKMIVCDFLTANADRHEHNLGVIRDVETLECKRMAPLYDNGRAFYYGALRPGELTSGLFYYESHPFSEYPLSQLALASDYSWYDPATLIGFPDTMRDVLSQNDAISDELIEAMVCQFKMRVERVNEYARERRAL
jgi:hypothetical protein